MSAALLTTAGFRDALEIGKEGRYDLYDLALTIPSPLVEHRPRFDVPERKTADRRIRQKLDKDVLFELCQQLRKEKVVAVAICFFAFLHESLA